jgi:hypothetical protein
MSLSTTYSLTDNDGVSHTFDSAGGPSANQHIFYADSPQDDLAGRFRLRVSHETTKSGIVRTLAQIQVPKRDSEGDYSSTVQLNLVLTRSDTEDIGDVNNVFTLLQYFIGSTGVREALCEQEV